METGNLYIKTQGESRSGGTVSSSRRRGNFGRNSEGREIDVTYKDSVVNGET